MGQTISSEHNIESCFSKENPYELQVRLASSEHPVCTHCHHSIQETLENEWETKKCSDEEHNTDVLQPPPHPTSHCHSPKPSPHHHHKHPPQPPKHSKQDWMEILMSNIAKYPQNGGPLIIEKYNHKKVTLKKDFRIYFPGIVDYSVKANNDIYVTRQNGNYYIITEDGSLFQIGEDDFYVLG